MSIYMRVRSNRSVTKMFVLLSNLSDILDLSTDQLQFISKPVLLRVCGHYVHYLWDKLPEYIKADSEVRSYRRYYEHYNQSW